MLAGWPGGSAELPDSRSLAHNLASTLINGVWQITAQQLGINFDQRSGALDLASAVLAGFAGYYYIRPQRGSLWQDALVSEWISEGLWITQGLDQQRFDDNKAPCGGRPRSVWNPPQVALRHLAGVFSFSTW